MTQKRAGRPYKNNSKVDVDSLLIGFLAKKENTYGDEICYMKVVDKEQKKENEAGGCIGSGRCKNALLHNI